MVSIFAIPALPELMAQTQGDRDTCIAVLDGPVDRSHPCFAGKNFTQLPSLVKGEASPDGSMSAHGTHVSRMWKNRNAVCGALSIFLGR